MQDRLARLGWTSSSFPSVPEAIVHARNLPLERQPGLMMIAEHTLDADTDLHSLRAALPDTRFERMARNLKIPLMLLPLTPRDLQLLTSEQRVHVPPAVAPDALPIKPIAPVLMVEDNEVNRL